MYFIVDAVNKLVSRLGYLFNVLDNKLYPCILNQKLI